jgi:hypothetical protein
VSIPLNERIGQLLIEIPKLQERRNDHELVLQNFQPIANQPPEVLRQIQQNIEAVERLTRTIDSKRQELISLELLMLDNSVKSLQSTIGQVDSSVKSLQSTTAQVDDSIKALKETSDRMLTSSTKLERMTIILVWITLFLGLIAVFNVTVVLIPINLNVGLVGVGATLGTMIYLWVQAIPTIRKLGKKS